MLKRGAEKVVANITLMFKGEFCRGPPFYGSLYRLRSNMYMYRHRFYG